MLIDAFKAEWQVELAERHRALTDGAELILLIDGAFVPGLFRELANDLQAVLLFESLPGCSEDARDVSPFLVRFNPFDIGLSRVLDRCNGWPMVSAIATRESVGDFGKRLAAWCVVEVDAQRFNFRFPDTRRLPAIFETLTQSQRNAFAGSALSWHYIGREGTWQRLPIIPSSSTPDIADRPRLNDDQFGRLVADSEVDEMSVRLQDRGVKSAELLSYQHRVLTAALAIAGSAALRQAEKTRWCTYCMTGPGDSSLTTLETRFTEWIQKHVKSESDASYRIA